MISPNIIPFSPSWNVKQALRNDISTVLDIGCGTGEFTRDVVQGMNLHITGIDLYPDAASRAKIMGIYSRILNHNITKLPKQITQKKYDLVLASQVIEHLPKQVGTKLLDQWEKLARKEVVVCTTVGFIPYHQIENPNPEVNPYQKHLSGWDPDEFRSRGYLVRGQGLKLIYGEHGIARHSPIWLLPLWSVISYLFSPLVYFFPYLALIMFCSKKFHEKK